MGKEIKIGFTNQELNFLKSILIQYKYRYPDPDIAIGIYDKVEKKLTEVVKISKCRYCKGTKWIKVAPNTVQSCSYCNRYIFESHDFPYWRF